MDDNQLLRLMDSAAENAAQLSNDIRDIQDGIEQKFNEKNARIAELEKLVPKPTPVGGPSGMVLQVEDNFETFDETIWMRNLPWMSTGGPKNDVELQLYQNENAYVENSKLKLVAKRENKTFATRKFDWTSGCVCTGKPNSTTDAKVAIRPGSWIEASIKSATGQGSWDAFWLLPVGRTWPPEIDIMELPSDKTALQMHHHWGKDPKHPQFGKATKIVDASKDFHTYGLYWDVDKLVWYFDGVEQARIDKNNLPVVNKVVHHDLSKVIPQEPMYAIINLAMGGWAGAPASSLTSATTEVDWFKLWTTK